MEPMLKILGKLLGMFTAELRHSYDNFFRRGSESRFWGVLCLSSYDLMSSLIFFEICCLVFFCRSVLGDFEIFLQKQKSVLALQWQLRLRRRVAL
jgi:hypothetical protein